MHNFLQDAQPTLRASSATLTQSFGLQRSWEQPEVLKEIETKKSAPRWTFPVLEKKQNYLFKRGNKLFIMNNLYKGII